MKAILKSAAALAVLAAVALPAFAASEPTEEVTVFAPYVVQKTKSGRPRRPVTTVTINRDVSYKDLDLKTAEGQATLEARAKQAAQDICAELDRRYPVGAYTSVAENKNCVREATEEVMIQVRGVEAAARAG